MRKSLIATVSAAALLLGGASLATAQDKVAPGAQDPVVNSPAAGGIKRDDNMHKEMIQKDRARDADSSAFRSYGANEKTLGGGAIAGGLSAEQLIGADVRNVSGKEIGEIEDLIIDSDNQINQAIVEVGGFLGIGTKHVAVDIAQLRQADKKKGFVTTMTKEELKMLPEYKKQDDAWVRSYN